MTTCETRPRGDADRAPECRSEENDSENIPSASPSQEAKEGARDLLREATFDHAQNAIVWGEAVAKFIACDDKPGLRYCAQKFVLFARETARGCKELLLGEGEGGSQ